VRHLGGNRNVVFLFGGRNNCCWTPADPAIDAHVDPTGGPEANKTAGCRLIR
jgi:hypothetical protein